MVAHYIWELYLSELSPTADIINKTDDICKVVELEPFTNFVVDVPVLVVTIVMNFLVVYIVYSQAQFGHPVYRLYCIYSVASLFSITFYMICFRFPKLDLLCSSLTTFFHEHPELFGILYIPRNFFLFSTQTVSVWIAIQRLVCVLRAHRNDQILLTRPSTSYVVILVSAGLLTIPSCWVYCVLRRTHVTNKLSIDFLSYLGMSPFFFMFVIGLLCSFVIMIITIVTFAVASCTGSMVSQYTGTWNVIGLGLITAMLTSIVSIQRLVEKISQVYETEWLVAYIAITQDPAIEIIELAPVWLFILVDYRLRKSLLNILLCKKGNKINSISVMSMSHIV